MRGGRVAWRSGIDHRDPASRPAEHESRAQTCRAAADHHHVIVRNFHERRVHPSTRRLTTFVAVSGNRALPWAAMSDAPALATVLAEVGPRLKRLRTRRGVTLTQLAAETGISKSTLSRLESGQRKPSLELLLPLAQAHQVPLDELVGAPEVGDPAHPAQAATPQRPCRLPADPAVKWRARLEGDHPARERRARASHARRLRMALRALGPHATDPGRARHHDAHPAKSPSSTPGFRTGSALPTTSPSRSSASTRPTASACTSAPHPAGNRNPTRSTVAATPVSLGRRAREP